MPKQANNKPKSKKRPPFSLDLPPDLRAQLSRLADTNELPVSVVARMCINSGINLVSKKLTEMREPAAMPS
jgi:predicted transcriptional regulator